MKLNKLILSGFKSFADKTQFDFDEGVSCIVGPNGCGKSNIVDAVKWVLGEQSAKSLRGSEMRDVLFNGSSARRPAGLAEVTLVFDNSGGVLQVDPDSSNSHNGVVAVTRRLYRSGQSEYLINKTPCRLKDIREMFMDTGIGRDAYSLIEQGRVELFLQGSHEERRAVFDEAAGISKYKARKREALRKLERVERNLLRLNDILGEVEKRLRSIKYQAGKARSYQTHTQALKELRSLHFLGQYHRFSQRRSQLQRHLDSTGDRLSSITTRIDQLEAARSATEVESVDLERASRELQQQISSISTQITTSEQRTEMLSGRIKELSEQITIVVSRCEQLEAKVETLDRDIDGRTSELEQIALRTGDASRRCEKLSEQYGVGEKTIVQLVTRSEDEKAGMIDLLRRTAQLHNEISGLGIRRETLHGRKDRLTGRADQIAQTLREGLTDRATVDTRVRDVEEVLEDAEQRLEQTKKQTAQLGHQQQQLHRRIAETREQRSTVMGRIHSLEQMQQRLQGVGEGVRRILEAHREGKLAMVRGALGEFVETDMEHAPLVEAAIGDSEQTLLVTSFSDLSTASDEIAEILDDPGTVEFLCVDWLPPLREDFDVSHCPLVIARVIDWVWFEQWVSPVMWRLLGRTLVVKTLSDAAHLTRTAPAGHRFVTLAGQVLEADGRIRWGAHKQTAGMITQRSELAELREKQTQLDQTISELEQSIPDLHDRRQHLDQLQQQLRTVIYEANTERVEKRTRLEELDRQIAELRKEEPLIEQDLKILRKEIEASVRREHQVKEKASQLEHLNTQRQEEIEELTRQLATTRTHQEQLRSQMTEAKMMLVQSQEKTAAIQQRVEDLTSSRNLMRDDLEKGRSEVQLNRRRRTETEQQIISTNQQIDQGYEQLKKLDLEAEEIEETRGGLQEKLEQIRQQLLEQRRLQEQITEELNSRKVDLSEMDVRIENLISRGNEEMQMNIPDLHRSYRHDEDRDWNAVENKINELREKIERLGNVNLDAIGEQEELQKRREFLAGQLGDVKASHNQLNELIRKINRESRQMFVETFEKIRGNFRELFRKLFGGGRADIFLVDEEDVLESGIEIVAQPPGKELRSLLLLSGGEKTMTALALLFSIFKSRPSPFCVLDEVDAALDEANNERFNHLVRDFVSQSQIVIISHAKRTMSMASVLYGVTMQEPGVSKRISVRFEDVGKKLDEQLTPVAT